MYILSNRLIAPVWAGKPERYKLVVLLFLPSSALGRNTGNAWTRNFVSLEVLRLGCFGRTPKVPIGGATSNISHHIQKKHRSGVAAGCQKTQEAGDQKSFKKQKAPICSQSVTNNLQLYWKAKYISNNHRFGCWLPKNIQNVEDIDWRCCRLPKLPKRNGNLLSVGCGAPN